MHIVRLPLEIRAISNISKGEEITINYGGAEVLDTEERRKYLSHYLFHCMCPACDISEENLIEETNLCHKWRELEKRSEQIYQVLIQEQDVSMLDYLQLRELVNCLKEMYGIAKKLKTLDRGQMIEKIVNVGTSSSFAGYHIMSSTAALKNLPEKKMFYADAQNFASVGLNLSTMLYGEDNAVTKSWQRRKEDAKLLTRFKF